MAEDSLRALPGPEPLLAPVADPVGDLVSRYARTHGPFTAEDVAARLGLGVAVVDAALAALLTRGRLVRGELRPGGSGSEVCDADVVRRLRRRSVAVLRREAEPVPAETLGVFLPAWQHVAVRAGTEHADGAARTARTGGLRGPEGVLRVVEQLQGVVVPASAWESLVLPARVTDYAPPMLDELTNAGEVLWCGRGTLPGDDGWLTLLTADAAPDLLPLADPLATPLHAAVLETLAGGGALFFRDVRDRLEEPPEDAVVAAALWDLAWAGRVSNDTLAPVRALLAAGGGAHRPRAPRPRARYGRRSPVRQYRGAAAAHQGPPTTTGRWWALPAERADATRHTLAVVDGMLERHGVLTRGAVAAEELAGGFATAYRVLGALEDTGRARRAYAVEGLGAAQFAVPGAVDRLRADAQARSDAPRALLLAATDPANPYGAALPWPAARGPHAGHRPGRKAGALVVLVDGRLALYVERGGRTLLSWWTREPTPRSPRLSPRSRTRCAAARSDAWPSSARTESASTTRRGAGLSPRQASMPRRAACGCAPEGTRRRCPRVTPSTAPRRGSTARSPATCWRSDASTSPATPARTSRARGSRRSARAASTC